jgi:hypothetical protein
MGGEDSFVQNNLEINSDMKSALDRPPPPVYENKIFLIVTIKGVFRIQILMWSALIWLSWILSGFSSSFKIGKRKKNLFPSFTKMFIKPLCFGIIKLKSRSLTLTLTK